MTNLIKNKKIKIWAAVGVVLAAVIVIRLCLNKKFDSVEALRDYIKGFGVFAPLALTLFQIVQVVVPVLPGMSGVGVYLKPPVDVQKMRLEDDSLRPHFRAVQRRGAEHLIK